MDLTLYTGILLFAAALAFAVLHASRVGRVTLIDWTVLAIGAGYGLGWIIVLAATQAGQNPAWDKWIAPFQRLYGLPVPGAAVLATAAVLGWHLAGRIGTAHPPAENAKVPTQQQNCWIGTFWTLLLLAISAQWLYSHAYGGYFGLLQYSGSIRSARLANVPHNSLSFLAPFGGLSIIACYGFWGLILSRHRTLVTLCGFVAALGFSLYILYSWLGRIDFAALPLTLLLGALLHRRTAPAKVLLYGGLGFVLLLVLVYGVSLSLNLKPASSFMRFTARELSFPFASLFATMTSYLGPPRKFVDFLMVPLFLTPSSWWSTWFTPVDVVNTTLLYGFPKGTHGVTGSVPVDLLTLGLYEARLIGIPLVGLLHGALLRFADRLLGQVRPSGVRSALEANVAVSFSVLAVFYAQPNLLVVRNFGLIACALLILGCMLGRTLLLRGSDR